MQLQDIYKVIIGGAMYMGLVWLILEDAAESEDARSARHKQDDLITVEIQHIDLSSIDNKKNQLDAHMSLNRRR